MDFGIKENLQVVCVCVCVRWGGGVKKSIRITSAWDL
jgi:hypothetical protein